MANGICVYAESYNGELETVAAELVSAAKGLAETTKEKVQAIVLSDHAEELVKELDKLGVDEIYAVKADHDITLQDDAVSAAIAEMLKKIEPSAVLVPATPQGLKMQSARPIRLTYREIQREPLHSHGKLEMRFILHLKTWRRAIR